MKRLRVHTWLWWGLGALWIWDGLLSLQRDMALGQLYMVTMGAWGEPGWYVHLVNDTVVSYLYHHHLATALDLAVFTIQIALGLCFLFGRHRPLGRYALYASLAWALMVWFFAEWMGGLLGGMSFLVGGPGAALLYAAGSLVLLAGRGRPDRFLPRYGRVLGAAWIGGAALQAFPIWWRNQNLMQAVRANLVLTPVSLRTAPISALVVVAARHPAAVNLAALLSMGAVGLLLLHWPEHIASYGALVVWACALWWLGENFGGVFGGLSTDPNTGIVWMMAALAGAFATRVVEDPLGGAPLASPSPGTSPSSPGP